MSLVKKAEYKDLGVKIGPYRAVSLDKNDSMLSGRKGWIYLANEAGTRIGVVTLRRQGGGISEDINFHDFSYLKTAVKIIGGIGGLVEQMRYANNPDMREP